MNALQKPVWIFDIEQMQMWWANRAAWKLWNSYSIDTIDLGFPIGLEADIANFVTYSEVQLHREDLVVLYTDGITEAEDINGVLYGLDRLGDVVSRHRRLSASEIRQFAIEDVRQHIGEQKIYDDITLLVLKKR